MTETVARIVGVVGLVAATLAAGVVLRGIARRTRTLRGLLLLVTFGSLAIGAVVAVVLAWLMVSTATRCRPSSACSP